MSPQRRRNVLLIHHEGPLMTGNPLPVDLRTRLAELGRRLHRQQIIQGFCRLVLVMIVAAAAAVLLDALVSMPGWLRGLLFIGWLWLGFIEIRRYIRGPVLQPLYAAGLAAAVEEEYPRLGERLTTAVELAGTSDPANGSPYLVEMLVRDADTRTSKLDLKRAAPSASTYFFGAASVIAIVLAITPLVAVPKAADQARRFFAPWHVPPIDIPYKIIVTSGDPTVKRGETTALSALIEPTKPDALLPSTATAVLKTERGIERVSMIFDAEKREVYLTRGPLDSDLEYQIVSGNAESEWHRITVIDPVRIESARITIVPPLYARSSAESPAPLEGLAEMTALQWSRIRFDLRFSRVPASAWLEWKPEGEEPGRTGAPGSGRINVTVAPDGTASVAVIARMSGEYRLFAEAGGVKMSFRPQPLRVALDTPPKFEKVTGFTAQPRSVRPGERLPIECKVVDDYGITKVDLEVQVNDKPAQVIPLPLKGIGTLAANGGYSLDLSSLAKEGDRVEYRLAATDNRVDSEAGLTPQTTYYPDAGRWVELRLSRDASPLKEQEILAQKKDIDERLREILKSLKQEDQDAYRLRADNARKNVLVPEQAGKLDDLQARVQETRNWLDELGHDVALSPALVGLAEAIRQIADLDVRVAGASLRQAQRDEKAEPRTKSLGNAATSLEEAVRKTEMLLAENERIAQERLNQMALDDLAERQQNLADETAKSGAERSNELTAKQKELEEQLEKLQQTSEPIRRALEAIRQRMFENTAREALRLEQELRDLNQAMKEAGPRAPDSRLSGLMERQGNLAKRVRELAEKTNAAARTAPLSTLKPDEIDKATDSLKNGNLASAVDQQERAAYDLDRLAEELESAVERARDPREAARQLERLQADLRQQLAESVKSKSIDRVPKDRREALEKQQQAIRKAAEKLSIPADAAGALMTRKSAMDSAGAALDSLKRADATGAADHMEKAREALARLAEQIPAQAARLERARKDVVELQKEQDSLAGSAEKTAKQLEKKDPDAADTNAELTGRVAELAKRQGAAAERLSKLDLPGHEERQAKTAAALRRAQSDLEAGRPQDIAASQQAARRELDRLEQAISGQYTADAEVDRLAKRQKELASQMKRNVQKPDAKRTDELKKKQDDVANDLAKLRAAESPASKNEALALARQAAQARPPQEAAEHAAKAAESLQRLADQINGRTSEADKADRLAKKQKEAADEVERLAKKKENLTEVRKQAQQMLDEVKALRPGADSQMDKQRAIEALTLTQKAGSSEQAAKASRDAADVLTRMAERMQRQQAAKRPAPKEDPEERLQGLPNIVDAEEARKLAEEQRQLRDELAQASEQAGKEAEAGGRNSLEDLIDEQEQIVDGSVRLAKTLQPPLTIGAQAAVAARQTMVHLKVGRIDPAKATGRLAAQGFHQIVQGSVGDAQRESARELACRQEAVLKALDDLGGGTGAAREQQQANRQRQLQGQAGQLTQKMQQLAKQVKSEQTAASAKADDAAAHGKEAEAFLKMAVDQNAKGERENSRALQDQAAEAVSRAARELQNAARPAPNQQGTPPSPSDQQMGRSIEDARDGMGRAQKELDQGQPGKAAATMSRIVQSLRQSAGQLSGASGRASPPFGATGNNDGSALSPSDLDMLGPLGANLKGKSWGDLPGQIKDQIISDMKARYGEEYAKFIKLYFEQLAERK